MEVKVKKYDPIKGPAAELDKQRQLERAPKVEVPTLPSGYVIKRRVTVPLWSMAYQPVLHVKVLSEIRRVPAHGLAKAEDGMLPVLEVADVVTGELGLLIASAVLESALRRSWDGYVGKCYTILAGPIMPGKDYRQVEVLEIEDHRSGTAA